MERSPIVGEQSPNFSSHEQQPNFSAFKEAEVRIEPVKLNESLLVHDIDTNKVDLVKVTNVTDEMIIVRCYGTKTKNINTAKLPPVSVDTFERTLLHKPRHLEQAAPFI